MIYIQTRQSVFPKAIYIGDKAELRSSFTTSAALKTGSLSAESFSSALDFSKYEIKAVRLDLTGENTYSLVVDFVPWHTGTIQLPDFEIPGLNENSSEAFGVISFEGIKVLSLVEQERVNTLKPFASPLLLPGTTYKIYGSLTLFLVLLILLIRLLVKRQAVAFWFKNICLRHRYSKNKRHTIRALRALEEENGASASKLQKIMREYLEFRLNYPFTRTLTSELSLAFDKACCSLADDNRQAAFENIISAFVRTDYIRFSNSAYNFEKGELAGIVNNLIDDILVIEEEKDA